VGKSLEKKGKKAGGRGGKDKKARQESRNRGDLSKETEGFQGEKHEGVRGKRNEGAPPKESRCLKEGRGKVKSPKRRKNSGKGGGLSLRTKGAQGRVNRAKKTWGSTGKRKRKRFTEGGIDVGSSWVGLGGGATLVPKGGTKEERKDEKGLQEKLPKKFGRGKVWTTGVGKGERPSGGE